MLKEPVRYDVIQRNNYLHSQITEYQYDVLGNRSQTRLPTGDVLNYLYYGSGHLHYINLNGETITDIERDNLHRPIVRSAGGVNTRFQFDPMGRLKQQISQLAEHDFAHHSIQNSLIGRQYHYDATGNLIRTDDKLNGNTDYAYDPLGRILQAADERFAFDPAHNISDEGQTLMGNRLMEYNGIRYRYDGLGNLTERHSDGESQFYRYDADNQLIEARIEKANLPTQYWQYRYDPFGRRILKTNAKTQQSTLFVWEGSRLLQEHQADKVYTYVYAEQNSYEPLAQIETAKFRQPESEKASSKPKVHYYHTDQIGIPREMTDEVGQIVWRGQYSAWGKLTKEEKAKPSVHQPFRLQNQYADEETGLHYNFFRYYDAHCGRFTQQDPIKLAGGDNLYVFAPNALQWVDILGLYTLDDARRNLNRTNAPKLGIKVIPRGGVVKVHSDTQVFNEWMRLEQQNMGWISNIPKCPRTINKCTEANGWLGGKSWTVGWYHPGATYEYRSTPNASGNANQCTYDENGNILLTMPAAGSADYAHSQWGNKINHMQHDVTPYELAEKLGRVADYYKVRPIWVE